MGNINDITNKKSVRQSPVIKELKRRKAERIAKQRYIAQAYDPDTETDGLSDMFSKALEDSENDEIDAGDQRLSTLVYKSSMVVRDLLNQFNFPHMPDLSFVNTYNVKKAAVDDDRVVNAEIRLEASFKTASGVKRYLEIPVFIVKGAIIPPSTVYFDGQEKLLTQRLVDHMIHTATSYYMEPLRENWASPLIPQEELAARIETRNERGYQPRESAGMFSVPKTSKARVRRTKAERAKLKHSKLQERRLSKKKGVPSGWSTIVEMLEKAQKDGEDTFPRDYNYLLRNYLLEVFPCVDNNHWEIALINAGWALNPYGNNRGRVTVASKKAQALDDFELELELAGKPVEVSDLETEGEYDILPEVDDAEPEMVEWFYDGTKTPIEINDNIKFEGHGGPIRAQIVELHTDSDAVIVKSKGMEYRVHVEDVKPLESTFKKMYI